MRVRIGGERAFLTVKGPAAGAARDEYEYPIPRRRRRRDARAALRRRRASRRSATASRSRGRTWEVDVFAGENAPLVVAEVEIERADAAVVLPPWVGAEVTDDPRYTNAALARAPFSRWGRR